MRKFERALVHFLSVFVSAAVPQLALAAASGPVASGTVTTDMLLSVAPAAVVTALLAVLPSLPPSVRVDLAALAAATEGDVARLPKAVAEAVRSVESAVITADTPAAHKPAPAPAAVAPSAAAPAAAPSSPAQPAPAATPPAT